MLLLIATDDALVCLCLQLWSFVPAMEQALQQSQQRISAMKSKFKGVVQYLAADGATTPERLFSTLHQFLQVQHITTHTNSHTHKQANMEENK